MNRLTRFFALVTAAALLVVSLPANAFALTQSEVNNRTRVTMRTTSLLLTVGETATLDYSLHLPSDSGNYSYTGIRRWSSSDTRVAWVSSDGQITARSAGSATITLRLSGGYHGECNVYVTDNNSSGYYYPRDYRNYYDPENPYYWEDEYWQNYLDRYFYSRPSPTASSEPYTVTSSYAITLLRKATPDILTKAAKAGGTISLKNYASVSAEALRAAASVTSSPINFDTVYGDRVVGRLTFRASSAANYSGEILTGVYCDIANTRNVVNHFNDNFTNEMKVVLIDQPSFSSPVEIAIKVGTMDVSDLYFYVYDINTNSYDGISVSNVYKDTNQFLHFTTSRGGYIIISDGALTKI